MRPADFVLLNLQIMMSLALRILLPGWGLSLCLFSSTGKEPLAVNFLVGESLIPEAVQIHHSGVILGLSGGLLRGKGLGAICSQPEGLCVCGSLVGSFIQMTD